MSAAREFFPDIFPCQIFRVRLDAAQFCAIKGGSDDVPSRHFGRDLCLVCVGILYGPGVGTRLLGHGLAPWLGGRAPALSLSGAVMIPSKPNLGIAVAKASAHPAFSGRATRTEHAPKDLMTDIPILNFDKDGVLESELPPVGPEITDVVLLSHGWHEEPQSAIGHYGNLVGPLEEILAQNPARWQRRRAAYFGVIWPSDEFADDLTVLDMRPDVTGPPPAGIVAAAQPLSRAALEARARDVAQFLGIDADLLAAQALQAASDNEGARDTLLS
ncbi:MAG: hypothetical protein WBL57_00600, partial [Methylovirgula sp.]